MTHDAKQSLVWRRLEAHGANYQLPTYVPTTKEASLHYMPRFLLLVIFRLRVKAKKEEEEKEEEEDEEDEEEAGISEERIVI